MRVNKGLLLKVQYKLYDAGEKDLLEETTPDNPLVFIHGMGMMLPAFEAALAGLQTGDDFDFVLDVEDAYGEAKEELLITLPKDVFMVEGKFDNEIVYEGALVPMATADGEQVSGIVQAITDNEVEMDFNHPLAGVALHFVGSIEEVREPTEDEYQAFFAPTGGCGGGCSCGDGGCGSSGESCGCGC